MEEIFDKLSIEQKIKKLKEDGLSFRGIAEKLNISLGKVQRIISIGNRGVSNVSENVSKRIDTPNTEGQNQTVGDYITTKELIQLKINIEDLVNKRLNFFINKQLPDLIREVVVKELNSLGMHRKDL